MKVFWEILRLVLLEICIVGGIIYLAALGFLLIYGPTTIGFFAMGIGVLVARTLIDLIDDIGK